MRFDELGLAPELLKAITEQGYTSPTPIQAQAIPLVLQGKDLMGGAQTGTGKTAAFTLPLLQRILPFASPSPSPARHPVRILILAPTRELAVQVHESVATYSKYVPLKSLCAYGGVDIKPQIAAIRLGIEVLVATPGRLLDLYEQKCLNFGSVQALVLDEADRMLDIGFRPDIERILKHCPGERQTLLLSATLPPPVERLAQKYMRNPQRVDLSVRNVGQSTIDQYFISVDHDRKLRVLVQLLIEQRPQQAIVFTRTKRGAEKVFGQFDGRLPNTAFIHGDLAQSARDRVMKQFREGKIRLLIATDVMGRGIDVSGISHIINFDIPEDCDDYVHRVGRTGRLSSADCKGTAFTFVCPDEGQQLTNVEIRINKPLEEYKVRKVEASRPRPPRQHVKDVQSEITVIRPTPAEEDDWPVFDDVVSEA